MLKCTSCGKGINKDAHFCPFCGAPTCKDSREKILPYCKSCGVLLNEGVHFCSFCGSPTESELTTVPRKNSDTITEKTVPLKSSEKAKKKNILLLITGLLLVVVLVSLFVILFKAGMKHRLEEHLHLGNAYLEEMNFDLALNSYAAAIQIDEKEPRAYFGQAEVYLSMARQETQEAENEEAFFLADSNLDQAQISLDRAVELVQSEGYSASEEERIMQENLEECQKDIDEARVNAKRRRIDFSAENIQALIYQVLGLPYIGNTSWSEYFRQDMRSLRIDDGYVYAGLADLDGDEINEIAVISLAGESSMGAGRNAMYLHVLEYNDGSWAEQASTYLESAEESPLMSNSWHVERDFFLRPVKDPGSIYIETWSAIDPGADRDYWSLRKYIYDGKALSLAPVGDSEPEDCVFQGMYYLFYKASSNYGGEEALEQQAFFRTLVNLDAHGLPLLDSDGVFTHGLIHNDPDLLPLASFAREIDFGSMDWTLASLSDWSNRTFQADVPD